MDRPSPCAFDLFTMRLCLPDGKETNGTRLVRAAKLYIFLLLEKHHPLK